MGNNIEVDRYEILFRFGPLFMSENTIKAQDSVKLLPNMKKKRVKVHFLAEKVDCIKHFFSIGHN